MKEAVLRFLIGGFIVSAFAVLGDLFEPKSFAGIFGAAPSVALATLALMISSNGGLMRKRTKIDDSRSYGILRIFVSSRASTVRLQASGESGRLRPFDRV
jgi:hypothetical protein